MDPFVLDEAPETTKIDPVQLVRMIWRRRWLFVVPFIICLAMAAVAIKVMTPIFESAGQIRVVYERTASELIEDGVPGYGRSRNIDQETLVNIMTIVTAPRFLEAAAREAHLAAGLPDTMSTPVAADGMVGISRLSAGARRLKAQLRVRQDGAHIFEIAVRSPDAKKAQVAASIVLRRFLEEERATRMAPRTSTRDFLAGQRALYESDLAEAEQELSSFQSGVVSATLAGNPINASNLVTADQAVERLLGQLATSGRQELQRLESQAAAILPDLPRPSTYAGEAEAAAILQRIYDLEVAAHLEGDGAREAELGRERVRLNAWLESRLQAQYPSLGVMDRSRLVEYLYHALYRESRERAAATLARQVAEYRAFVTRQPEQSSRLAELQAEVTRRRNLLLTLEQEVTQQTMNVEASRSEIGYRIEVRRDPGVSQQPVEPDKVRLSIMGLGLSLAIGLGLVILSIFLDRSFTDVDQIERTLRLPVIGTLPVIHDEHFARQRQLRLLRWALLTLGILAVAAVFVFYLYPRFS